MKPITPEQNAARLKRRYPKSSYAPKPDCEWCHGQGTVKKKGHLGFIPCMCLFVQHSDLEIASKVLTGATAEWFGVDKIINPSQTNIAK